MKPKYRPLDAPEPSPPEPSPTPEAGPSTPVEVRRPPLPPPGSSRDRREQRIREFWESRDRAERRRAPPPDPA